MKLNLALICMLPAFVWPAKAGVNYAKEPIKSSDSGRLQWTIGKRGSLVVHKVLQIDRGNKGIFDEFTEQFFVDGKLVLTFSKISGDYMIDCTKLGSGVVSLYFRKDSHVPDKVVVGKDQAKAEVYFATTDGLHLAASDDDREKLIKSLGPLPGFFDEK